MLTVISASIWLSVSSVLFTCSIPSTNNSGEAHLSIARFFKQTLALMTVSASSLSDVSEDGLAIVDISKLTTVKVLDKRSSSSGVKYKCELYFLQACIL
jgi:hypothetical protein